MISSSALSALGQVYDWEWRHGSFCSTTSEYTVHRIFRATSFVPHTNDGASALTVVGRTIQPRPFVVFEYYCFFDHGSVVTSGVHHENHFRFMNRKNVFFPKRKEKMDATTNTRCLRLEKKSKWVSTSQKGEKEHGWDYASVRVRMCACARMSVRIFLASVRVWMTDKEREKASKQACKQASKLASKQANK